MKRLLSLLAPLLVVLVPPPALPQAPPVRFGTMPTVAQDAAWGRWHEP